jgi:hypothetical protein
LRAWISCYLAIAYCSFFSPFFLRFYLDPRLFRFFALLERKRTKNPTPADSFDSRTPSHHCKQRSHFSNIMSNYPGYNPGQFQQPGHGFAPPSNQPAPMNPGAPGMNQPPPMMQQPGQGFASHGNPAPMAPGHGFAPPPPGQGFAPPPPGGIQNPNVGLNHGMGRMNLNAPAPNQP